MMMKNIKGNILVAVFLLVLIVVDAFATDDFNATLHSHFVNKNLTYASTAHASRGQVCDGISYYITKINNSSNQSSNYNYIRIYMYAGNTAAQWTCGSGGAMAISGDMTNEAIYRLQKQVYYEFLTAYTGNLGLFIKYFGNDPTKDAYVYIREGFNQSVSTSNS